MTTCIFCIEDLSGNADVEARRMLYEYAHWWLVLQPAEKRKRTRQAAGMLVSKRHFASFKDATADEAVELLEVYKDAGARLCQAVKLTYAGQENLAFNDGKQAGQTIMHVHAHIIPLAHEDPEVFKTRSGIGAAFEALTEKLLGSGDVTE